MRTRLLPAARLPAQRGAAVTAVTLDDGREIEVETADAQQALSAARRFLQRERGDPRADRPEGYEPLDAGLAQLRNGMFANYGPEAHGLAPGALRAGAEFITTPGGVRERARAASEGFTQERDATTRTNRALLDQGAREAPIVSFLNEMGGGMMSGHALERGLVNAARMSPRAALYTANAAQGATYGSNEGESGEERGRNALLGGAMGLAIPAAFEGVGAAFLPRDPNVRAARLVRRVISTARERVEDAPRGQAGAYAAMAPSRRPRVSPETLERRAARTRGRSGRTSEMAFQMMGRPGTRMARALQSVGNSGGEIVQDALEEQGAGVTNRVMTALTRAVDPHQTRNPTEYWDALDALRTSRAGQARDAFGAAYRAPVDQRGFNGHVRHLMSPTDGGDGVADRALRHAERIADAQLAGARGRLSRAVQDNAAQAQRAAIGHEIEDIIAARRHLRAFADGEPPTQINARALEYYQQGIWDLVEQAGGKTTPVGGALSQAWNGFVAASDRVAPALADARQQYGRSQRIEDLMEEGRRVFERPEGQINVLLRGADGNGLSVEEVDGLMLGVGEAISRKLQAGDIAFVQRLMRNRNWQEQIRAAVTGRFRGIDPKTERSMTARVNAFFDRVEREVASRGARNAIESGSQTTPRAQDVEAMTRGEDHLGFLTDAMESGFNPSILGQRWLARAYEWFSTARMGIRDERVAEELGRILTTPITKQNMARLGDLLTHAAVRDVLTPASRRQAMAFARAAAAATRTGHKRTRRLMEASP